MQRKLARAAIERITAKQNTKQNTKNAAKQTKYEQTNRKNYRWGTCRVRERVATPQKRVRRQNVRDASRQKYGRA